MSTNPKKLLEDYKSKQNSFLDSLEKKIDEWLLKNWRPEQVSDIVITFDEHHRLDSVTLDLLKRRYPDWVITTYTKNGYDETNYYLNMKVLEL